jgi:hypothetical protein
VLGEDHQKFIATRRDPQGLTPADNGRFHDWDRAGGIARE